MREAPYREIPLRARDGSLRAVAVVDETDYEGLMPWRWSLLSTGYAQRGTTVDGRRIVILMHRQILGLARGERSEVDHISGNRLDNRRHNLRVVTRAENMQNIRTNKGKSIYRGVHQRRDTGQWVAAAKVGAMSLRAQYPTEIEAAIAAAEWRLLHMPLSSN